MAERIRLFANSTELEYSEATINKSNDSIVDNGHIVFGATAIVGATSTIEFRKNDGTTKVFSGIVNELKKPDMWEAKVFTNGYELLNLRIEQVYTDEAPEDIVSNVIGQTKNLTYASSDASGVTITKYIAKGYAIDIIKDMMDALRWQIRIDENDNFYFEPEGKTNNGVIFTHGSNINITSWIEDKSDIVNRIKIIGGFESFNTSDTTATGTSSILSHKPSGAVRVLEGGTTEITAESYTINADDKEITYGASTLINPQIDYNYNLPIIVDNQNDGSINDHGEIYKEINHPEIDTFVDARRISQNLLDKYSEPMVKAKGVQPKLNFDVNVGEEVKIIDTIRSKEEDLVITKITYDAAQNTTTYEFGERDTLLSDWNVEVQNRIKKLEKRFTDEDQITFVRLLKEKIKAKFTVTQNNYYQSMVDSLIVGHSTLGRVRTNKNFEADCSDNGNNGTWSGTGIDGSQYSTSGWRLSSGVFNGTDNKVTILDDSTLDFPLYFLATFAIKPSALGHPILKKGDANEFDGYSIDLESDGKITMTYGLFGGTKTKIYTAGTVGIGEWSHIALLKEKGLVTTYINGSYDASYPSSGGTIGLNNQDLKIGADETDYFDGEIDEVRLYELQGDEEELIEDLYNKEDPTDYASQMKCYLSFNNPRVGDRMGATVVVS